jgi:hypothetical protein
MQVGVMGLDDPNIVLTRGRGVCRNRGRHGCLRGGIQPYGVYKHTVRHGLTC